MTEIAMRRMTFDDVREGARLQPMAFPPPFREDLLWTEDHLCAHVGRFPESQFVATFGEMIVGTSSSFLISEENWQAHGPWKETVGSAFIGNHNPNGTTLYGLDITVHPAYRKHYGLNFVMIVRDYMDDAESGNAAALLEWLP